MTTKAALFALLALWGVGTCATLPAFAEDATTDAPAETQSDAQAGAQPLKRTLTNRVWVRQDSDLPGVMRIFLSDGTMVSDSCWETHRLSPWRMTSDNAITWNEDGMDINAEVKSLSSGELVLDLLLGKDRVEERYAAATVPFVCPDMPK